MSRIDEIFARIPTTTLFHYTSLAGLLGIVGSGSLWASDVRYLNDAAEFERAVSLLRDTLTTRLRHENGPWNTFYGCLLERIGSAEHPPVFAASLSEDGDLLSQWRGYCPPGLGCSIGFDYDTLRLAIERQEFRLVKCVYDPSIHQEVIDELIAYGGQFVRPPFGDDAVAQLACDRFIEKFSLIGPVLKHPSFSEEREWRLVRLSGASDNTGAKFRVGRSTLIPYYAFALTAESKHVILSRVCVGPTAQMDLSTGAIRRLLAAHKVSCGEITATSVTYRAW